MKPTTLLLAAALALTGVAAHAADAYPSQPIHIVVPFPPGGSPDILARVIGDKLTQRLGQTVIVDNKPGASGTIGAAYVARSAPDGYTLMMTPNTFVLSPLVLAKGVVNFDVQKDFEPVILPSKALMVLAAHPSLGVKNLPQLVKYAKEHPGVTFTGSASGSPQQIAGEMLKKAAGVDMTFIPYKGLAPALSDTVGGQVQLIFVPYGNAVQYIKNGALVDIGGLDQDRASWAPEVVPLHEQGYPDLVVGVWSGLFAPHGTPAAVVAKLNSEINAILQMPDVRQKLEGSGQILVGGGPENLAKVVKHDLETYAPIVKSAHITAE
jgi:tripartite-type tricarboxylate transporter receptor subunit TctC